MKRPIYQEEDRWFLINAPDTLRSASIKLNISLLKFYREICKLIRPDKPTTH